MKEVTLKLAEVKDAEFILSLRLDEGLNKHLSKTKPDLEAQKQWLAEYKKREGEKQEFYYIIYLEKEKVGTIRVYNIDYTKKTCTWGSFIIKAGVSKQTGNPRVSVIALYKIFNFIFNELGFKKVDFDVRKENSHIRQFYINLGGEVVREDEINSYLILTKGHFLNIFLKKYSGVI